MKYLSIVIVSLLLLSFKAAISPLPKYFYFVEPFKEQEIKLTLRDDSTFSMIDDFGLNSFSYIGKYKYWKDEKLQYIVFYEIKLRNESIGERALFPLKSGDTAILLTEERLYIQKEPFCAAADNNTDLLEVRYQLLKTYYTRMLGPKEFLNQFGDGNEAVAKENLIYPFRGCSMANRRIGASPPPTYKLTPPAINVFVPLRQPAKPQRTSLHDL